MESKKDGKDMNTGDRGDKTREKQIDTKAPSL
jgi:hypothetical protein